MEDDERAEAVQARRQAIAVAALLQTDDVGEEWVDLGPAAVFSMSAELAATIPACRLFVGTVFDANTGVWAHAGLGRNADIVFTSVTVFATTAEAAAMVAATSRPDFDPCWAAFNEVAVVALPFGIESATYASVEPPAVKLAGDSSSLHALEGTVSIGPDVVPDTCVCVFIQEGRAVLALHSAAAVFTLAERHDLLVTALARIDQANS